MRVNRIMLISEASSRDITASNGSDDGITADAQSQFSMNFSVHPSEDKPWPYEIDLLITLNNSTMQTEDEQQDGSSPALFSFEAHYAAEFDQTVISEEEGPRAFEVAWPFLRADVVDGLHRHELPATALPFSIAFPSEATAE